MIVLAVSLIISQIIQWLLMTKLGLYEGPAGIVVGLTEGVVAAIAAGLVLYQLKIGEELDAHQTNVEEAQFILEYNRSFIENEKMTEMERYMECMMTGVDYGADLKLAKNRQDMINYLVYLEGLASCIHGGILDLEIIDDLFSYRFFLAMNHPEVQSIDLLPYATYYRGSFRLYDKWLTYRMSASKYENDDDWDIPLAESSLCYQYGYEKYATPEITTKVTEDAVTVLLSQQERGKLSWAKNGKITVSISERHLPKDGRLREIQRRKLLRAMLKELLYNEILIDRENPLYLDVKGELNSDDDRVKTEFQALQRAKNFLYQEGAHFRQLNSSLKISEENLKAIARLIYRTDNYIYPDMFATEEIAEKIIPELLRSGKDSMFNLNNIYVCELCENVIGMILWHEGTLNWSSEELCKVMRQHGITPPAKLNEVEKEYISGYSKNENNAVTSILNICVVNHARGKQIGKRLLTAFLREHPHRTAELCVLTDNKAAINLYSACGFRQHGMEEQAYPQTKANHSRIIMRCTETE